MASGCGFFSMLAAQVGWPMWANMLVMVPGKLLWVGQHVGSTSGLAKMLVMVPGKWLWVGQHVGCTSGLAHMSVMVTGK